MRWWASIDLTELNRPRVSSWRDEDRAGVSISFETFGNDPVVQVGVSGSPPRPVLWLAGRWEALTWWRGWQRIGRRLSWHWDGDS